MRDFKLLSQRGKCPVQDPPLNFGKTQEAVQRLTRKDNWEGTKFNWEGVASASWRVATLCPVTLCPSFLPLCLTCPSKLPCNFIDFLNLVLEQTYKIIQA
jgi:hypothetical protein